jgi:hypothetical protein
MRIALVNRHRFAVASGNDFCSTAMNQTPLWTAGAVERCFIWARDLRGGEDTGRWT